MSYQIEEIELEEFTGMWLNNVSYFKMTFKEIITLILGRNGCGKSRLMQQLSPLAPDKSDFRVDGKKRFVFSFNGEQFETSFNRTKGGLKCYITNLTTGEKITDGTNPTVHNTVIRDRFNYDKDLHELFTGRVLLSEMKTPERKRWFSKLSTSDLSYALEFYKKAKENSRDLSGAIKSLRVSIGELRPRVIEDKEVLESTKRRIEVLQNDISLIDTALSTLNTNPAISLDTIKSTNDKLDRIHNELAYLDVHRDKEIVGVELAQLQMAVERCNVSTNLLKEQLTKIEEVLTRARQLDTVDIGSLENRLTGFEQNLEEMEDSVALFRDLIQYDEGTLRSVSDTIRSYSPRLMELMSTLDTTIYSCHDENGERVPLSNIANFQQKVYEESGLIKQEINRLTVTIHRNTEYLKAAEAVTEVECNKCTNRFKPGVDKVKLEEVRTNLVACENEKIALDKKLVAVEELCQKAITISNLYRELSDIVRFLSSNQVIMPMVNKIHEARGFNENQSLYIGIITTFTQELESAIAAASIRPRIAELKQEIAIAKASQLNDTRQLEADALAINRQLNDIAEERALVNAKIALINEHDNRIARMNEYVAALEKGERELDNMFVLYANNVRAETMREHKAELWGLLTTTRQRYEEMERERIRLEDQEQQLISYESRYAAAKHVVEAMSPDGGLLARYLYLSITRVTELMSEYVSRMWGYEMKVMPCDVSDGDMDYQFPFWVGSKDKLSSDVSKGSRAQKEVIDFVFVLAVYRAMGMKNYPLLLDELSSGFDEGHRNKLIEFLKHSVATQQCSQIIMVSHNSNTHNQLIHADVCVIDPEGVVLPAKYNQNVEIC